MNILDELTKLSRGLHQRTAPLPLAWPGIGPVGHLTNEHGVWINSAYRNAVDSMLRENDRIEALAADVSNGRLAAAEILEASRLISDTADAARAIKKMQGAILSFNDVIDARGNGQYYDHFGCKASQATTANQWSAFNLGGGNPSAASYTAIPGGARMTSASAGAIPIPLTLGGSDHLYLTNAVANHVTGNNLHLFVDLLVTAGSISTASAVSQTINTTGLSRWTNGEGVYMTLEVTTQIGGTAANINISTYTDQGGTAGNATGNIALTPNAIVGRLLPVQDGPMIRLAAGDYGVRSVEGLILSASMGAGALALHLYKPIIVCPTMTANFWVERSTPAQLSGIKQLTSAAGGEEPFIGRFIMPSSTSTGTILEWLEFVYS